MRQTYSWLSRFFHWIIVALLLGQWWLADQAALTEARIEALALLGLHKSFGITILALAIFRLMYRFFGVSPIRQPMPAWQRRAASFVHTLFYALLFVLPLSGWLGSSASAYSVSWFGLFTLSDLVAPDEELKTFFFQVHEWGWRILCALVCLHVTAALKHHWLEKNNVLRQMLTPGAPIILGCGLFVVFAVQSFSLSTVGEGTVGKEQLSPDEDISLEDDLSLRENFASTLPPWEIDYEASKLAFTAEQSGAKFSGSFNQWETKIYFDEKTGGGLIITTVDLLSVDTSDAERDGTLQESDFFDTSAFPEARFIAHSFVRQDDEQSWLGRSHLLIKGLSNEVEFRFSVQPMDNKRVLLGRAILDRLALQVGIGEWSDTQWIGQSVVVDVSVVMKQQQD